MKLAEALEKGIAELEKLVTRGAMSAATIERHRWGAGYFVRFFGDVPMDDFVGEPGYRLLERWVDGEAARGITAQSLLLRRATLSLACRQARRMGTQVLDKSQWPKLMCDYTPRDTHVLPDEFEAICKELPLHRALYACLTLATAMHRSDIEGAPDLGRLPMDAGQLRLTEIPKRELSFVRHNSKNLRHKIRPKLFPIPQLLAAPLYQYLSAVPATGPIVTPWIASSRELTAAAERAGVPKKLTLTDLRRTAATWWLERDPSNRSLFILRDYFGHTKHSKMIEDVYARVTSKMSDDLIRNL
jgi:integrase